MKYKKVVKAKFIERPNRFIAFCDIDGKIEKVHVKNTGRCRELLTDNAVVYLEESDNPNRKTKYSLICVEKGNRLINMDSQVPNKVVYEGLIDKKILPPGIDEEITFIKAEKTYKNSRFDIYLETKSKKIFIEVKGVTLEENDIVKFPDAKTERGVKHINELIEAKKDGYECYILFLIQMNNVLYFTPNNEMHKDLGDALVNAENNGVGVLAYDRLVEFDSITVNKEVKVIL